MTKIKKAVILAGGLNLRMMPISKVIPKALLPIGNKPVIQYIVEECIDSGINEIYIVIREKDSLIKRYFEKDKKMEKFLSKINGVIALDVAIEKLKKLDKLNEKIKYIVQKKPKGEAHAILQFLKKNRNIKEDIAVLFSDTLYQAEVPGIQQFMNKCIKLCQNKKYKLVYGDSRIVVHKEGFADFFKINFNKPKNLNLRIEDVFDSNEKVFCNVSIGDKFRVGTLENYYKTFIKGGGI